MSRLGQSWIAVTMLFGSAASMALEIVAGRLLAPYVGMSLYSWTAIITVVLAGLSAGHWIGGWLTDRTRAHGACAGGALLAAAAASAASLVVLRHAAPFALSRFDPISGIGALALAAFFVPSLFAGFLSPILTRMALEHAAPGARGRVLGRMFALGALGAIVGTACTGFWLISFAGSHRTVMLVGLAYAVMAPPYFRRGWVAAPLALAALIAGAAAFGPDRVAALATPCRSESAYYCIRVDPISAEGHEARVMALDHLGHGINVRDDPTLLVSPYLAFVDEMTRHRLGGRPPEAFFVGGGAFTLPRAWAARYPGAGLTVAEIDPAVTAAAETYLWLDPSGLEILHRDGRIALRDLPPDRRFDVIFGDAFKDISIPQHLVTDEFHALVQSRLKPAGIYAVNVIEALYSPTFLASLTRTLEARFTSVELWLDLDEIEPEERRVTWLIVASDRPSGLDRLDSTSGPKRSWVRIPADALEQSIPADEQILLTDDLAPVDRLMRHVLFDARLAE